MDVVELRELPSVVRCRKRLELLHGLTPQVRPNIVTALDGKDLEGQPFIAPEARITVRGRLHLPQASGPMPDLTPAPRPTLPGLPSGEAAPGGPGRK